MTSSLDSTTVRAADNPASAVILVTGATGRVGGELVAQLAAAGHPVRAMSRRGDAVAPAGVERVAADFGDPASLAAALRGVDRVFAMSAQPVGAAPAPTHDLALIEACRRAGVARIVKLSVLGGGGDDPGDPIVRWHREAEAAVRASGAAWTLLRPGRFMSNALGWAAMIRRGDDVHVAWPARRAASIDPADLAAVAMRALIDDGHAGATYELSGPESLAPADEVRILGEMLGRSLRVVALDDDAVRAGMVRHGMPPAVVDAALAHTATDRGSEVLPTAPRLLGRPARRFADWAEAHRGAFR
jgi:uncharacterized protein YbjT (DUF2867 family)